MRILVDADACPVASIVEHIAKKYQISVILLCDTNHILQSDYSEVLTVGAGADAVDFKLVSICRKGDIVVTQDYGVAAMILGKGAYGIHQSGRWYTNDNIDRMLMERHLAKKARNARKRNHIKGPAKRTAEDDARFAESLEKLIFTTGNPSFPSRMSVEAAREGFEASFEESDFYNKQTQDEKHLNDILAMINVKPGMRVLDLGCGSGYLTFPIARMNENTCVIGLDIVTDTLKRNAEKAREMDIKNLEFVTYDGVTFPFEDNSFDLVVTRYALHHFPEIRKSIREVTRVLKCNGIFFISDPRPNDCDITRFVDDYMQLKKDGHIKFYTKDEWVQICGECNMHLLRSFDSEIRFPRKKSTAEGVEEVLARHEMSIIDSYGFTQTEDEIWVTEQVNNLLFQKNDF